MKKKEVYKTINYFKYACHLSFFIVKKRNWLLLFIYLCHTNALKLKYHV